MTLFKDFGLSDTLLASLDKMNYAEATPIQAQSIPLALEGHDILGSAQTGTGKTAAFSVPLVEKILNEPESHALILTPTRELAKQVLGVISQLLGAKTSVKTAFIIGGEPMAKQFSQLKAQPRIVVGTPGRVNDHLERGTLKLNKTNFLVLDETDRMLDMGFGIQLDKILKFLPKQRQTMMFSATLPKEIVSLSGKYLTEPKRVAVGETNVLAKNIEQEIVHINQERKYDALVDQINERDGSIIVFIKTKHAADRTAANLRRDGIEADALHGDLRQGKRTSVMNNFRNRKFRVLVATDIAARGLDVPHIEHVINFDLPQVAEDYIHRMGRTARAGAKGSALCFISPQQVNLWRAIERLLNPDAAQNNERGGFGGKGRGGKGQGRPATKKFGSKFRPDSRDGRSSDDREFRGKGDGRKEYRGKSDNRSSRSNDDNRGNNFESNEGRKIEAERKAFGTPRSAAFRDGKARPQGDRPFGNRAEGGRSEGNRSEGRSNDFRSSKPRSAEGRSEGRGEKRSEYRGNSRDGEKRGNGEARAPRKTEGGSEPRGNGFRSKEGRPSEGRSFEGRSSEGRKDAPRGGKPTGKPNRSDKPKSKTFGGGDKPFTKKPRTTRTAA